MEGTRSPKVRSIGSEVASLFSRRLGFETQYPLCYMPRLLQDADSLGGDSMSRNGSRLQFEVVRSTSDTSHNREREGRDGANNVMFDLAV